MLYLYTLRFKQHIIQISLKTKNTPNEFDELNFRSLYKLNLQKFNVSKCCFLSMSVIQSNRPMA